MNGTIKFRKVCLMRTLPLLYIKHVIAVHEVDIFEYGRCEVVSYQIGLIVSTRVIFPCSCTPRAFPVLFKQRVIPASGEAFGS